MIINTALTLAVGVAVLAAIATASAAHAQEQQRRTVTVKHAPITSPGDVSESWSARQNIKESEQYERLLRTNPAFRKARMQKECGGITDPQLRQSCLASFDNYKS
jgi:hypothetical protein